MQVKILFIGLVCLLISKIHLAQTKGLGSWNLINVKGSISNKLSIFSEAQLRSLRLYNNFHYHEVKAGINYEIIKGLSVSTCIGKYDTYKEGGNFLLPKNTDEVRVWQQIAIGQKMGKIKIDQRFRIELRFTTNGFRSRSRYRIGLSHEFGKRKQDNKPFTILINNEVFFEAKEPYFERNRSQMAINYKLNKILALQLGYVHQFDYKINDETGRDFIMIGMFFEFLKKYSNTNTTIDNNND